ncbi:hypothetical protein BSY18_3357 [Blastomonas sp. RAC04]|nr:hypothetical protein BSY18_3357 [Blastomonas sp. RAC04]
MAAEAAVEITSTGVDQADRVAVEEAILQTHVPAVAERSANACQDLPRKAGVRIVQECSAAGVGGSCSDVRTGNTDTAADKALKAIIGTEVDQAVQHEREHVGRANCVRTTNQSGKGRTTCDGHSALNVGHIGFAIADFSFETERAEIVADNAADIIAGVGVEGDTVVDRTDVELDVLDEHGAAFDANIPLAITGKRRCGQGGRCQRQSYD